MGSPCDPVSTECLMYIKYVDIRYDSRMNNAKFRSYNTPISFELDSFVFYLSGFVDGKNSFCFLINKSKKHRFGL